MSAVIESEARSLAGLDVENRWDEFVIVETRVSSFSRAPGWRPALNAYRCVEQFVVFVDLAGVPPAAVEVDAQADRLVIRGTRPAPEPGCERSELAQLLALEIDHGNFERILDLPQAIDPERVTTEYGEGLLRIQLPLAR